MSKIPLANGQKGYHYYTKEIPVWSTKELLEKDKNENNTHKTVRLRTAAIVSSWVSGVFSLTTGVAAIVMGQVFHSQSLFGYGLDGVLDSLSSVVVLWRFYDSSTSTKAESRERKACIVVSLLFFVSAFSLIFKSAKAIIENTMSADPGEGMLNGRLLTTIFCSLCGAFALVLATVKVYVGRKLGSQVLIIDSIITFVGAAISFLGILAMEMYTEDRDVWYLDGVFGMCCGAFLFLFGLKMLVRMTCCYKRKEDAILEDSDDTP
ncbi:hypothetical protein BsWGS_16444 [Bradybaena similaris]